MPNIAVNKQGGVIVAHTLGPADWAALKAAYVLGDLLMPCCKAPAVPKTSINGVQFFAHQHDECATAPETQWHQEAKALVVANLALLGHTCRQEVIDAKPKTWQADTYFEIGPRRIAIEMQRSYQHVNEFVRRHERYRAAGVECYWLLRQEVFQTLGNATAKIRLRRELGGKAPPPNFYGGLPELPVAYLDTTNVPTVKGARSFEASVTDWLQAVIDRRFRWDNGVWDIATSL